MYFIILAAAATLYKSGKNDIQSATDAATALQPFVGKFAATLFALGLVGAGMLAVNCVNWIERLYQSGNLSLELRPQRKVSSRAL